MFLKPDYDHAPAIVGASARPVRRRWSLAARLTAWYAFSAFGLILLATSLMYGVLAASFEAESDRYLANRLAEVKAMLAAHEKVDSSLFAELRDDSSARRYMPVFFRILDEKGQVVAVSVALPNVFASRELPSHQTVWADGRPYRLLTGTVQRGVD